MLKIHPKLKEYYFRPTYHTIDSQLYFAQGGGSNAVIFSSRDNSRILLIDTKSIWAHELKKYVDRINPSAEITIVLTHYHTDHIRGVKKYPNAQIIAGNYTDSDWKKQTSLPLPNIRIPVGNSLFFQFHDENVHIKNMGGSHTRNDLVVYFEERKILVSGDIVYEGFHPVMHKKYGTDINQWINNIQELQNSYNINYVIPGHGRLSNVDELEQMKTYLIDLKKAAKKEIDKEQLKKKYEHYLTVPGFISLNKNIRYAENGFKK